MKRGLFFISLLVLTVVGGVAIGRFWMENSEFVQLRFLYWRTYEISQGSLVIISFLLGVGISGFFLGSTMLSKYFEARRLRRENSALQKMLEIKDVKEEAAHSSSSN